MQTSANYPTVELSPENAKAANTCFVCDKKFRSARQLMSHQRGGHTQVLVFEISKENRSIKAMSTLWRVGDFDELFANDTARKRRIRKPKHYCSSDSEPKTEAEITPGAEKLDI